MTSSSWAIVSAISPCAFFISARLGTSDVSGQSLGFHARDRINAFGQWHRTRSTLISVTSPAGLPLTASASDNRQSKTTLARPFTRMVSPCPGIMNNSPTASSRKMFSIASIRLLPGRSGSARVFGSRTFTKPGGSPRGVWSIPPSPRRVPRIASGEAPMKRSAKGSIWWITFESTYLEGSFAIFRSSSLVRTVTSTA